MRSHALGMMALAGLALGGCYATTTASGPMYEPAPPPPVYAAQPAPVYRYFGPHPIPLSLGGGWCWIEGAHDHDYLVSEPRHFTYLGGVYRYVGPYNCSFSGQHPVAGGGWCYINYPHSHDYCPSPEYRSYYQWDRVHHAYTYQSNGHQAVPAYGTGYHGAEPAYGSPGYHAAEPAYGSPGYHGAEPAYGSPGYHGAQPAYGNGAHGAEPAYGTPGASNGHGASAPGYVPPSYGGHGATAPGNVQAPPTANGAHGASAPGTANGPPGLNGNHPVDAPAWGTRPAAGQYEPHPPAGNPGGNGNNPSGNGVPGSGVNPHQVPPGHSQVQEPNNFRPSYPGNQLPDPHVVNRPVGSPGMSHGAPVHGVPQAAQQNPNQNQHHDDNNGHGHGAHGVKK